MRKRNPFLRFGGTTLVGVLLGQPPSWTLSGNACRSLVLAFWLAFCCPGDYAYRAYWRSSAARLALALGASLSFGHAVTSWGADKALRAMHAPAQNSGFSALMAGAFGGSGGGLLGNLALDGPPSYGGFRKAAVGSAVYYALRDPHGAIGLYEPFEATTARLAIGVYSVASAFLGPDRAPAALAEGLLRVVARLPATVGGAKAKEA